MVEFSWYVAFDNLDKFDEIIINHYRLSSQLYSNLMNYINRYGLLWGNGFNEIPIIKVSNISNTTP